MDDDFFRRDFDHGSHGHDNLFAWTIFILLLIGIALAVWLGSFYVFGHPENPRSYNLLVKLKKIDPPKRFELTAAPPGEFLTPQKIYEKYAAMSDSELAAANAGFLRDFLRNYQDTKKLVPYLIGRFTILNAHALLKDDMFPSGVVSLAQATNYPQVLLEHVYTADAATVPQLQGMLTPGLDIKLEKTLDLSAIIHIQKLDDGRLLLTAVPLLYGTYALKQGTGIFSLEPPTHLHLEGGVPITKVAGIPPSSKVYAVNPQATPADQSAEPSPSEAPSNPELLRVMPPMVAATPKKGKKSASATPTPVIAEVTPPPQPIPTATPTPVSTPTPEEVSSMTPTPAPVAVRPASSPRTFAAITPVPLPFPTNTPGGPEPSASPVPPAPSNVTAAASPTPALTPIPVAPGVAANNPTVPLQPFIEAKASPAITSVTGSWKTYRPGQMPRGRLLKVTDAANLADRGGTAGERLYLSGQFVVTASGENRAVLRAKNGLLNNLNPLGGSSNTPTRVLVEFPAGYQPPAEGSSISRDEYRPFEIRDVQRAKDGTINVFVREVTTPD